MRTCAPRSYTLSLHDALPISGATRPVYSRSPPRHRGSNRRRPPLLAPGPPRSEEHTSELQPRGHLVCRLLLEKKNASKRTLHWIDDDVPGRRHVIADEFLSTA